VQLVDVLAQNRVKEHPDDARVRLGIAHARMWRLDGKTKHRSEAKKILTDGLSRRPAHVEGWEELGMVLKSLGEFRAAAAAFATATKYGKGVHRFQVDQAETLEQLADIRGAETVLKRVVETYPTDRVAWGNLANLWLKMNRLDQAEKAYDLSNKYGPSQALTASNRGYLELRRKNLNKAEKWFKEALRRDGTAAAMYANLGTLELAKGHPEKAVPFYEFAISRDPNFGIAYWMLGRLAMDKKNWSKARGHLNKMISVTPKDVRGYLSLAETELRAGKRNEALRILLVAQKAIPNHPTILQAMIRLRGKPKTNSK